MPRPRPVRCAWCKPRKTVSPQLGRAAILPKSQFLPLACWGSYRGSSIREDALSQRLYDLATAKALMRFAYPEYREQDPKPYEIRENGVFATDAFRDVCPSISSNLMR